MARIILVAEQTLQSIRRLVLLPVHLLTSDNLLPEFAAKNIVMELKSVKFFATFNSTLCIVLLLPKRASDRLQEFVRSEEHTSELQSRVDISYAVFCLKKK